MKSVFLSKIKEAIISVLPISLVVILLTLIFVPNCGWSIFSFSISTIFLIIGICLFSVGNETSLMKIGGFIGSHISKTKKIILMILLSFLIGTIVTIAESDLYILATQIPNISNFVFIITVGISVGFCLVLATLRIILNLKIKYVLAFAYSVIFVLMFFTSKTFLPIAFDASGVTTGSISVPFIIAFGLGISAVRSGDNNQDDSFGLLAMCSVGPIFAVMLMSVIMKNLGAVEVVNEVINYNSFNSVINQMGIEFISNLKDVALILLPICALFFIYNTVALKLPKQTILRILVGIVYTYIGITLFFVGAKLGFLPVSSKIATSIFNKNPYLLIPIGLFIGLFIVIAEPAIQVLNKQVYDLSSGTISKVKMLVILSIAVAIAILLSVLRILFELNFLIIMCPLILLAVVLAFFCKDNITAIAFDSGGVAAGVISSTFVLPFMQGICLAKGLDLMTFGFGTVGIIVLVPIIIVEIMGIEMKIKENKNAKLIRKHERRSSKKVTIIEFD